MALRTPAVGASGCARDRTAADVADMRVAAPAAPAGMRPRARLARMLLGAPAGVAAVDILSDFLKDGGIRAAARAVSLEPHAIPGQGRAHRAPPLPLPLARMNPGTSPRALRSAAVALAARLRLLAVNASRCRAIASATAGGSTSRTAPVSLTTSKKTQSPTSRCRYVCTM